MRNVIISSKILTAMGIIIDLKDFNVRTPEQVVRIFYSLYTPEMVREQLLDAFMLCDTNSRENPGLSSDQDSRAQLFDHLIALTDALDKLRAETTGKCVICGGSSPETAG